MYDLKIIIEIKKNIFLKLLFLANTLLNEEKPNLTQ